MCGTVLEMIYGVWDTSRDDIQCVGHFHSPYIISRDDIQCVGQFYNR